MQECAHSNTLRHLHIALKAKSINAFLKGRYFHYSTFKWAAIDATLIMVKQIVELFICVEICLFLLSMRSWKVGKKALKVLQAQVCTLACAEEVHWTIINDINVWQIKWLVNNLLTALTSEPLLCIDQPAVPGFVWRRRTLWCLQGWMERATKNSVYCCLYINAFHIKSTQ